MRRHVAGFSAALLACCGAAAADGPADRDRVTAVFKSFLRDSAELPMDVAVTTVVTNAAGRQKRHTQATVHLVFHGYNQQAERFTLRSDTGFFHFRELHDSIAGDFEIFKAFSMVVPGKDGRTKSDVEFTEDNGGLTVRTGQNDCRGFDLKAGELWATQDCSAVEFRLGRDAAGELTVERFRIETKNLPARGNVRYLGPAEVRRLYAEGELQKAYLPGDPRPFLAPKHVVTTIETDKGKVVVTGEHAVAAKK
jgi:hypothetical protein